MLSRVVPEWTLVSEAGPQHQKRFTWKLTMGEFSTTGSGHSKKIARQGAAEQMMATLPEEWKQKRLGGGRKRSGGGGGWFNNQNRYGRKRPAGGGYSNPSPPKKKPEDEKIVITADNPVSCLYEYAKKVSSATH